MTHFPTIHKSLALALIVSTLLFTACKQDEEGFKGEEIVYTLTQGSDYNVNGTVTFTEQADNSTVIAISLKGTEGDVFHPVHLHLGDITTPDAEIAAFLQPVKGNSGISSTTLKSLDDGTNITFSELKQMEASIKVHLSDVGAGRDIVLAGGNIGAAAATKDVSNGRLTIAVCRSN